MLARFKNFLYLCKHLLFKDMKIKEIVYAILDLAQNISDDSAINESHVLFLLSKYRALLLTQYYKDNRVVTPSNYQTLCIHLEPVTDNLPCTVGAQLKSVEKIPNMLKIAKPNILLYNGMPLNHIIYVPMQRLATVGYQDFQKNFIYCAIGDDQHLYFRSKNPQASYLEELKFQGVFEDVKAAAELSCNPEGKCDFMEENFPVEESLGIQIIDGVLKEVLGAQYRPADAANNAFDDLSDFMTYIRQMTKKPLQQQIEG